MVPSSAAAAGRTHLTPREQKKVDRAASLSSCAAVLARVLLTGGPCMVLQQPLGDRFVAPSGRRGRGDDVDERGGDDHRTLEAAKVCIREYFESDRTSDLELPISLSRSARQTIHRSADSYALHHRAVGPEGDRRIIVSRWRPIEVVQAAINGVTVRSRLTTATMANPDGDDIRLCEALPRRIKLHATSHAGAHGLLCRARCGCTVSIA